MRPERWQESSEIFNAVLDCPPNDRAALIEQRCGNDEALRREVELLLSSYNQSDGFIESPAFEVAPELLVGDAEALLGRQLGYYRIDSVLGVGGMGVVYLAHDERLDRKVALKLLPPALAADAQQLQKLKHEARTASALNHPNIVTIHEIGEADGTHYIATEFIEGITLRERIAQGPVPPNEALDYAAQVASAICVAHEAGIVHRDIKPENLFLLRRKDQDFVKVVDFGISKSLRASSEEEEAPRLTQTGMVLGTPL